MSICDRTALVVAERHSGAVCVTVGVDHLNFLAPAKQGDTLIIQASINRSWNSSMEIGVRVYAEKTRKKEQRHIISAYFTFVALDEQGHPIPVPEVAPCSDEDKRRYEEAGIRRQERLKIKESIQRFRANS